MSAARFDPDDIMSEVRAKTNLSPPAKAANPLTSVPDFSSLAELAARTRDDADAIEERAGLGADHLATGYLGAWARLNDRKPFNVSEAEWRQALDDGGRFLDAWGTEAATMRWTPVSCSRHLARGGRAA
jgi:hypothetical protein